MVNPDKPSAVSRADCETNIHCPPHHGVIRQEVKQLSCELCTMFLPELIVMNNP